MFDEDNMDLKSLLADIELNIRELKYLSNAFTAQPDDIELRELLLRKITMSQTELAKFSDAITQMFPSPVLYAQKADVDRKSVV